MLAELLPRALSVKEPEEAERVKAARAKVVAGLQEHSTKAADLALPIGAFVL